MLVYNLIKKVGYALGGAKSLGEPPCGLHSGRILREESEWARDWMSCVGGGKELMLLSSCSCLLVVLSTPRFETEDR